MAEVIMPKMGDGMTEGKLLSWLKQDGVTVKSGDAIAEIETDKTNVEVEAEDDGVLRTVASPGDTLPVGAVIATIGDVVAPAAKPAPAAAIQTAAAAPQRPAPVASAPVQTPPPAPVSDRNGVTRERIAASPLARRIAREQNIDIARISGTGPNGRVIEADVTAFAVREKSAPAAPPAPPIAQPVAAGPAPAPIELSSMRKTIARRMVESKTTIPHFYITSEVDVTELVALREKLNAYDETLTKISINDLVVKATGLALKRVPAANVSFQNDKIIPGSGIHVGIAVALDDGLIVPVVRDTDQLPLRKLAEASRNLIKRARDRKLQPADYTGGTFTVSNLGSFDVVNFTAIIDPSQGAILAVASVVKKPVVLDDDTIAVRQRMNVTFSGDHRVMDGAVGAKFLQELKRLLQNPLALLEG